MTYGLATLHAATGSTLLLPGWLGYFKWDFNKQELYFVNGEYYLNELLLLDKGVLNREDWYYIT